VLVQWLVVLQAWARHSRKDFPAAKPQWQEIQIPMMNQQRQHNRQQHQQLNLWEALLLNHLQEM
jgi:hypothetical protein